MKKILNACFFTAVLIISIPLGLSAASGSEGNGAEVEKKQETLGLFSAKTGKFHSAAPIEKTISSPLERVETMVAKSIVKSTGIRCPGGEDLGAAEEVEEQADTEKTKSVFQIFRQPPPIDQIKPEKTEHATFALG